MAHQFKLTISDLPFREEYRCNICNLYKFINYQFNSIDFYHQKTLYMMFDCEEDQKILTCEELLLKEIIE